MYIGLYSTSGGGVDRGWSSSDITWFHFSVFTFGILFFGHIRFFGFSKLRSFFAKMIRPTEVLIVTPLCIHWDSPMSSLEEVKNDPFLGQFWTSSKTTLSEVLSQNGFQTTPQNDPKKGLNGGSQSDPFMGHFSSALLDLFTRGFEPKRVPKQTPKRGRKHLIEENSVIWPFFDPFFDLFQNHFTRGFEPKRVPKHTPKWVEKHLKVLFWGAPYHMKNGTFGYKNDPFLGSFLDLLQNHFTRGFEPKRVPNTPQNGSKKGV